ncbi:helix-turn-helix domain-containing protein [Streptomyces xanthochromogenes]|uniref:helix-turn-helix domain-containing protein n=1 Tax=Streptomyces xanthochromogenes TaxID=67384 RepID=UPI0037F2B856
MPGAVRTEARATQETHETGASRAVDWEPVRLHVFRQAEFAERDNPPSWSGHPISLTAPHRHRGKIRAVAHPGRRPARPVLPVWTHKPARAAGSHDVIDRAALHVHAVRLYCAEELPIQEIADRLGYSYYTVRKYLMTQEVSLRQRGGRPTADG